MKQILFILILLTTIGCAEKSKPMIPQCRGSLDISSPESKEAWAQLQAAK